MREHTPEQLIKKVRAVLSYKTYELPEGAMPYDQLNQFYQQAIAERDRLKASNAELLALCKRAINESARVRPDFMADLQAAITRAALSRAAETKG